MKLLNMGLNLTAVLLVFCGSIVIAAYTTPNTGVHWNLDSLVIHSSGTITGSFPNYVLTDVLTVSANDRVDILPGTILTVQQGSGIGFTVLGALTAVGTATDSIIVKGAAATAGSHRGFRFEDSSVDSLCVISYCRIQDAIEGVHCLNSSPTITHSQFTNTSSNGVRCFAASPVIRNCVFIENRRNGITANLGSSPLIEDNLFIRNNSENTGARNTISVGAQGINNPIIRRNEIFNENYFRTGAISLVNIESSGSCAAVVEENYLHNNSFGILSQGVNMTPLIRGNRIENNRINADPMISGSGISVQTGGASNTPIITGNIIKDNYWGITIVSSSGLTNSPQPNIGNLMNSDTTDDGWNIFINNNNGGTIYQLYNNGTANISAQNNYWGSRDSSVIESWITHQPDSSVFGFVNYLPFGFPGIGRPDTFRAVQISQTEVQLFWSFPQHQPGSRINLLQGLDSLSLILLASLPDTQTSYVAPILGDFRHYFGLSSSNRFGLGDTTILEFWPLFPHVGENEGIPRSFELRQNYPNPFNPGTTIVYRVASREFVELGVYDVLGRRVATLVNGVKAPGSYEIQWSADGVPSGVYYYTLRAGNMVATRSLVILR